MAGLCVQVKEGGKRGTEGNDLPLPPVFFVCGLCGKTQELKLGKGNVPQRQRRSAAWKEFSVGSRGRF